MRTTRIALAAVTASLLAPAAARAQSDSSAVVAVIAKFHASLAAGDSTAALALLADDVRINEGRIETKADYRSGHLRGDMAYAKAVPSQRTVLAVSVKGDAAWVMSSSVTQGEYNGRTINNEGSEVAVLTRAREGWKIWAVSWTSRPRRTP